MIYTYGNKTPQIGEEVFLADNAAVVGDVKLERGASVWFGAVIRGDESGIEVGENTNIQDNATLHGGKNFPVKLGKNITVGHNAVVHGCTVGDNCIIGMGSVILNGAVIGEGCLIGAGALIKEGMVVPPRSLCVGVPAKVVRTLDEAGLKKILDNAALYTHLAREYQDR